MENKELQTAKEYVSYEEFQKMLKGNKKPSVRERVSIIHPPELSDAHSKETLSDNSIANEHELKYLYSIGGNHYQGMSKQEFNKEVNRVFGFPQDIASKKKTLASKLKDMTNNSKFVKNAQNALYLAHGLAFTLGSMATVNGYDSGNKSLLQFGLTTGLLSALGLYSTYKFAKASSDVCNPLLK